LAAGFFFGRKPFFAGRLSRRQQTAAWPSTSPAGCYQEGVCAGESRSGSAVGAWSKVAVLAKSSRAGAVPGGLLLLDTTG
jgi:hypothetical protein